MVFYHIECPKLGAKRFFVVFHSWQVKLKLKTAKGDKEGLGHQFFHQKLAFDMV